MQEISLIMPGSGAIPALTDAFRQAGKGRALILPAFLGMDTWIDRHSLLRRADSLKTLFVLFQSFRKHHNPQENLAAFFPLGQVLLADFDLILRAGRDPAQVFTGLQRWEATGAGFADFMDEEQKNLMRNFSALFRDNPNESRSRFLRMWENLPAVFREMEEQLIREGLGTSGMVYRDAAKQLADQRDIRGFHYFVGFSGISQLEINLMQNLAQAGKADFIWDLIPDYAGNPLHEVNRVFSRLRRVPEFQSSLEDWTKRCQGGNKPDIKEIACPGLAGMAQWILSAGLPPDEATVFIVSDPAMMQLLTGRGKLANGRNLRFSMGYPLNYTPVSRWVFKVMQWISRPKPADCQPFLQLSADPIFQCFFPEAARQASTSYSAMNLPALPQLKKLPGLPDWLFYEDAGNWPGAFAAWLEEAVSAQGSDPWLQASSGKVLEICRSLAEIASLADKDFSFPVLQSCLQASFQGAEIQLQKEDGPEWKAIGLFESRNLDFRRVVIFPADEGLFPSGGRSQSLIPDAVRRAFSLPLRFQENEDEAYQFYRLCHRSEEVIFLTSADVGKRRSRFLDQIQFGGKFRYSREFLQFSSELRLTPEIKIMRNEAEMEKALAYQVRSKEEKAARKLSPSSLHALISCPLRYHYQKIAGLQEPEEISGMQMSAQDFGNWIHTAVQLLLEKVAGHRKIIRPEEYDAMEAAWDSFAGEVWSRLEGKKTPGSLSDFPVEQSLGKIMAERFFRFMKQHKPHRWLENEYPIPEVKIGQEGSWFGVSGRADIVLEEEDCFRLLDLKTGAFRDSEKLLLKMGEEGIPAESKMVEVKDYFQMLAYNRLASEDPRFRGKPVRSCLFYLSRPKSELADPFLKVSGREEEEQIFAGLDQLLLQHLGRLVNPAVPVTQAADAKVCTFCAYNAMCRR